MKKILAGPASIRLEITSMGAVQAKLGGTVQHGGDAGGAASWLCFTGKAGEAPVIYWFVSNDEMANGSVSQVAIQRNEIGRPEGCSPAPAILKTVDFGIPSFGSPQQAVTHYFGGGRIDAAGVVNYVSERPEKAPPPDCSRLQSVQYLIRNGRVSTIIVSQVTSC